MCVCVRAHLFHVSKWSGPSLSVPLDTAESNSGCRLWREGGHHTTRAGGNARTPSVRQWRTHISKWQDNLTFTLCKHSYQLRQILGRRRQEQRAVSHPHRIINMGSSSHKSPAEHRLTCILHPGKISPIQHETLPSDLSVLRTDTNTNANVCLTHIFYLRQTQDECERMSLNLQSFAMALNCKIFTETMIAMIGGHSNGVEAEYSRGSWHDMGELPTYTNSFRPVRCCHVLFAACCVISSQSVTLSSHAVHI